MNKLLFLMIFSIISILGYSQDMIVLKNGTKVEAKVVEISSTSIKYYKFEQQDGPVRILEKYEVSEIIYKDGTSEKFNVDAPSKTLSTNERPVRVEKPVKDPFFSKGFFIEGFVGASEYSTKRDYYYYYDYPPYGEGYTTYVNRWTTFSIGLRIGNKWYFGKNEKWRPGIQVTWLRLGAHIIEGTPEGFLLGPRTFSLANVGMTNVFKFNEKIGMEANFSIGPTINIDIDGIGFMSGFSGSLEAKLRVNKHSFGIDYQFSDLNSPNNLGFNTPRESQFHTIALTVGRRF